MIKVRDFFERIYVDKYVLSKIVQSESIRGCVVKTNAVNV